MKTLYLLRHAKSSWDNANLTDFERPLNERGMKAAPLIGRYMKENNIVPDIVICSPAVRANETADLVIEAAEMETEFRFDEKIYEATWLDLLRVIAKTEDEIETLLLIGHNPGFEETVFRLTDKMVSMPTAALVKISLDIARWNETKELCGNFEWIVKPKDLRN